MKKEPVRLTELRPNAKAKIIGLEGGAGFQRRLRVLGIKEGQIINILSRQPLRGPITISAGNTHVTIGRGMSYKIIVEEL